MVDIHGFIYNKIFKQTITFSSPFFFKKTYISGTNFSYWFLIFRGTFSEYNFVLHGNLTIKKIYGTFGSEEKHTRG